MASPFSLSGEFPFWSPADTSLSSFIHGGAWRDPRNTYADFEPAVEKLQTAPEVDLRAIAGFASLGYRLSSHPQFPEASAQVTDGPAAVKRPQHPAHIKDIWLALAYLQQTFDMGDRYILIGHSAGATLAFQLLMGSAALGSSGSFHDGLPCESLDATSPLYQHHSSHHKAVVAGEIPLAIRPPVAVIGIAGIYDFFGLNERMGRAYQSIFTGAFGDDPTAWNEASPACFRGNYAKTFPGTRLALLAWSPDDELIDEPDIDHMAETLAADGVRHTVVKDITGNHDFVWRDGSPIVRLVAQALNELKQLDPDYPSSK